MERGTSRQWAQNQWRHLTDAFGVVGAVVLVGTVAASAMYVLLFVTAIVRHPTHLIVLLFNWQTQTGAAFAIAAAWIGALAVVHQTRATERQAEERRKRRAHALRSVLPLLLSELSDYAERCAEIVDKVLRNYGDRVSISHRQQSRISPPVVIQSLDWPKDRSIPPLPSGFTEQLTDLIEVIPPAYAKPLIELIRCVQLQHSRAMTWQREVLRETRSVLYSNLITSLVRTCEVHARCTALSDYAHNITAQPPPPTISAREVKDAAFSLAGTGMVMDGVISEIERLWPEQGLSSPRRSWRD
jgi:hypothetical protein